MSIVAVGVFFFNLSSLAKRGGADSSSQRADGVVLMLIDDLFVFSCVFLLSIAVNLDNTLGAVGFVPAFARKLYPVTLVR